MSKLVASARWPSGRPLSVLVAHLVSVANILNPFSVAK